MGDGKSAYVYFFGEYAGIGTGWSGGFAKPLAIIIFAGLVTVLVKQVKSNKN